MTPTVTTAGNADLPRIVILGGGVGAVTAAFQLSKPGWRTRFRSITLYQQGWRLGGKGASGRGRDGRIEEHGLHIWFGFYENAFRMMRECHEELDRLAKGRNPVPRWDLPFKTMEDSFRATTEITVTDHDGCGWKLWTADFFEFDDDAPWKKPDPRLPGERPDDWTVAFYMVRCLRLAADLAWSLARSDTRLRIAAGAAAGARQGMTGFEETGRAMWSVLSGDVREMLNTAADALDAAAAAGLRTPLVLDALELVMRVVDFVTDFLRIRWDEVLRASDAVRRAWYVIDIMIAIVRGVIEDGVIEENSFAVIDHVDFRDWLMTHGAGRDSIDCALTRAVVYDLAFAYEGGDPQRPSCGAGTALRGLLRTFFTYRGALMWKMNAGMGDVVFAPLLELLHKRGVDVEFFHRVEAVRAAGGRVEEIEIDVQAHVPPGTEAREYLASPPGAPKHGLKAKLSWPADPSLLLKTPKTKPVPPDVYESWYAGRATARVGTKVLQRGAEPDGFELVVFGLPISCVPGVAPDLVAQSHWWSAAVDKLRTVPTQAVQLWLDKPAPDLADVADGAVVGGFVEPFDTWADMVHLRPVEHVGGAATVAYFCNVLVDDDPPERGKADAWLDARKKLVKENALRFLRRDVASLWPKAVDPFTRELHWKRLIAPPEAVGHARLDWQYLRANVEPSERYVLSVPGSSVHRIPPAHTGFTNLYAAGDWTACQLDCGCVEAAVISGLRAANGIHEQHGHHASIETIVGEESP